MCELERFMKSHVLLVRHCCRKATLKRYYYSHFFWRVKKSLVIDVLAKAKKRGFAWANRVIGLVAVHQSHKAWPVGRMAWWESSYGDKLAKLIHIVAVTS